MIANVLSLNEVTKKYRVTFDSGDKYAFTVHIGDKIVKFPDKDDKIYLSEPENIVLSKVDKDTKRNIIEGLNNLKTVKKKEGF